MDYLPKLDWSGTFAPQLTLPEVLVRGTVVYFALLALLRVVPKWQAGPGSIASLLFVVLLGGLAADAVKGKAESVTDLLLLVVTVMLWVIAVDWLSYRFPWFRYLAQDSPTCLIRDGRILRKNLRREMITEEDLKAQLRRHDVDDIGDVRETELEADGSISVVKKEKAGGTATAGATSPAEAGAAPEPDRPDPAAAGRADESPETDGRHTRRPDNAPSEAEGQRCGDEGQAGRDDPELKDFLAAARRLQASLEWHQEQVAKFKEALALHGVRFKPPAADRRGGPPTSSADGRSRPAPRGKR